MVILKAVHLGMKSILFAMVLICISVSVARANLTKTDISQLYVAVFNRASEGEGNHYWQRLGLDMATTSDIMLATQAAKNYFGTSLDTNQDFIEHIYLNTLNKTRFEDRKGVAFWVELLNNGASYGEVVASLVTIIKEYAPGSPSFSPDDAAAVAAYQQFTNRVEISDYMADTLFKLPDDWERTTKFDALGLNVTDNVSTVTEAKKN